jgi:hypothetical protein
MVRQLDSPDVLAELSASEDAEEVAELLNGVFDDLVCLRCQRNQFAVIDDLSGGPRTQINVTLPQGRSVADLAYRPLPLITLVCRNCGHVEQFSEDIIRARAGGR